MRPLVLASLLACAAPVAAQSVTTAMDPDETAADHGNMDHSRMDRAKPPTEMDHSAMGHGTAASEPMNHSGMGESSAAPGPMHHSNMDHGPQSAPMSDDEGMDNSGMAHEPDMSGETMQLGMDHSMMEEHGFPNLAAAETPPPAAGSGPPRAADAIWGAEAMTAARETLRKEQGGQLYTWFMGDRFEYRAREGKDGYLWDAQGFYGGDINKLWIKTEGEGAFGERIESADVEILYDRAIGPFFSLQAGVRRDFAPRDRTYAAIGVQGLAPYLFEVDATAYVSDQGDLTATVEGELDQRITQRLILQPRGEVRVSAQDVPELGIGAGIDRIEAGLRLRYHFAREFAPYLGVEQEWRVGGSADFARSEGEDPSVTNYVVGVRFWF
ncbi:MAG: copper resistance protein B [Pacificimonas sp.]